MIKLMMAGITTIAIAGAATAQMSSSGNSAMTPNPNSAMSGKSPTATTAPTHMMKKKKTAKDTRHNGRSSMPTGGADTSATTQSTPPR